MKCHARLPDMQRVKHAGFSLSLASCRQLRQLGNAGRQLTRMARKAHKAHTTEFEAHNGDAFDHIILAKEIKRLDLNMEGKGNVKAVKRSQAAFGF